MKSCLVSGYVFVLGFAVYESFEGHAVKHDGLMPVPDTEREMSLGGHAVLVIGYDDAVRCPKTNHVGAFKVRNSWGADWGDKGNFWMPYEVAANHELVWDCWIQHLGRPW
jgi:C1A family cysteine protease